MPAAIKKKHDFPASSYLSSAPSCCGSWVCTAPIRCSRLNTGIYFARNVDATLNYGPLLENVTHTCLRSRDCAVSVGSVGELGLDLIARRTGDSYAYAQASMPVADPGVERHCSDWLTLPRWSGGEGSRGCSSCSRDPCSSGS